MTSTTPTESPARPDGRAVRPPRTWADGRAHFVAALGSRWYQLIIDLHDILARATYEYGYARGLKSVQIPVTTRTVTCPTGLGSDSQPVPVSVSGVSTYLSDSAQFLLEYGCRTARQGCYTILPSFRAETPDPTHLGQFVHSEAEIRGGLEDLIEYVEGYVRHLTRAILHEYEHELARAIGDVGHLERALARNRPFDRLTLDDAARLLSGDPDHLLSTVEGRYITRRGEQELLRRIGEFVWVTHFDHLTVPFYQAFAADERSACNADLFFGIGEVVGSGERHIHAEDVRRALALHRVPERDYAWYVRMKDIAPIRTAGFGLGVERFLLWVLKHDDIRDIPLVSRVGEAPEWPDSIDQP